MPPITAASGGTRLISGISCAAAAKLRTVTANASLIISTSILKRSGTQNVNRLSLPLNLSHTGCGRDCGTDDVGSPLAGVRAATPVHGGRGLQADGSVPRRALGTD